MHTATEIVTALLSWPAACIVAVLVLHRPIARLIDRVVRSDRGGEGDLGPVMSKLGRLEWSRRTLRTRTSDWSAP
jgi:hypothetical protein